MGELKHLVIEGTAKAPKIDFNHLTGELILAGKSIPENAAKVYEPLMEWVNEYVKSPRPTTNFRLNLEYYNTSSYIWFAKLIKMLAKIEKEDYVLFIHKYFDIEDFEDMNLEEIKDSVSQLVDNIGPTTVSIGVKAYGVNERGKIVKESMILV
jgi:SiaC family regulatory phosphoprotein